MRTTPSVPAAVERAYDLLVWLDLHLVQLPAHTRAALGAHCLDASVRLLGALLDAAYAPREGGQRTMALRDANRHLTLLRDLVRALHDRRHLSHEQRVHAAALLDDLGRQVGAWSRAS